MFLLFSGDGKPGEAHDDDRHVSPRARRGDVKAHGTGMHAMHVRGVKSREEKGGEERRCAFGMGVVLIWPIMLACCLFLSLA